SQNCPYFKTEEYLNQNIPLTLAISSPILTPNQQISINSTLYSGQPQAYITRVVSLSNVTANVNSGISNLQAPGYGETEYFKIPLTDSIRSVIERVLKTDLSWLPLPDIEVDHNATITTEVTQLIFFNNNDQAVIDWTSGGLQSTALLFSGESSTVNLSTELIYKQYWNSHWYFVCSAVIVNLCDFNLYNNTNTTEFFSQTQRAYTFYEVSVNTTGPGAVSQNGTAWYLSGYKILVNAHPLPGDVFSGFYEHNTLISNSTSYTIIANSPKAIVAEFVPIVNTPALPTPVLVMPQFFQQTFILGFWLNPGALFIAVIIVITLHIYFKLKKSNIISQQDKEPSYHEYEYET
ncbi:MAG: hypothetical protein ACHQX1_02000, partial [Candidatus Micrarchaeales archaeon]